MTPQDALDLLDQASAQVVGSREVHKKIVKAVEVLQIVLDSHPALDDHELGDAE